MKGIAFAGFVLAVSWLEINNDPSGFLWFCAVIWLITTDWGQK